MTSILRKKRQTIPSSIRRTTPFEALASRNWAMCCLVAGMITLVAADVHATNPRRRSTPLERLKHRSASARWDEIRQTWNIDRTDGDAKPGTQSPPEEASEDSSSQRHGVVKPTTAVSLEALRSPDASGSFDPWIGSTQYDSAPAAPPQSGTGAEAAPTLPSLPVGHSTTRPKVAPRKPTSPVNVWQQSNGETVEEIAEGGLGGPDPPMVSVLPKPITSILPYHDYTPNGEDPCEYMCPRPAGCPESEDARPCPEVVEMPDVTPDGRYFAATHVMWEPSNLFHNPLYFEDHALERYGHTHCEVIQPFVSVGKFGAQLIGLPYQMALHPICEHQYVLGWHRPGECVPYRYYFPPWNAKAAITAGAVYTGLIFLIP